MAVEPAGDGADWEAPGSVPRPGDVVGGKFVVERVLGLGGMGVVVAAHHSHLEQTVAIKFLRHDAAKDEATVSRFLREARAVAALQSEHIVRVMDAGLLDDGLPYLVMEYLNGTDLDHVLVQKGRLTLEETVDYLLQAMEAVAEAHAAGIVHRDLKPSNLFLVERSDGARFVKVLDFGISKALDVVGRQAVNLTSTSMTLGSPLYMSPEQVRSSKNVDARTDIWAIGIIAYELLAGVQPFEAETVTGLCAKIVADDPIPLRSLRPDVPAAFEALVMRCLEKNVVARFQSVGDLAAAMRPFATPEGMLSVSRIKRISGGLRPTLASAGEGRMTPVPSTPATSVDAATGYAETIASWQAPGPRQGKRALFAKAATAAGILLLALSILLVRWQHTQAAEPARSAMAAAVPLGPVPPPVPPATKVDVAPVALAPTPAPAASPRAAPDDADHAEATPAAHASTSLPPAVRRVQAVKPQSAPPPGPAKAPVVRSPDDLLIDRK